MKDDSGRTRAIKIFEAITFLQLGDYHLLTNNCRHYVIAVASLLREMTSFKEQNWTTFKETMNAVLRKDNETFESCLSSTSNLISLIRERNANLRRESEESIHGVVVDFKHVSISDPET